MKKTFWYFLIFNPVTLLLFCLLPTIESRRGLILMKLKDVCHSKYSQVRNSFTRFFNYQAESYSRISFPAKYLGKNKLFVYLDPYQKRCLSTRTGFMKAVSVKDDEKVVFSCYVSDENLQGIIISLRYLSPKKRKTVFTPTNDWYFLF